MKSSNEHTDIEIVELVKKGDTSAFRLLVERYEDVSFSLACSIIHNEHDAEDALQESFVKAFKNLGRFRLDSKFSSWLYRIVVNTCYTLAKKKKKNSKQVEIDDQEEVELPYTESGFEDLMASERAAIVNQVLDALKTDEALVLRLYYLSELSLEEIMSVTGFKTSKVKVTLFRGRKNLENALQKIFGKELNYEL